MVKLPGTKAPHRSAREAVAIEPDGGLILATNQTVQRLDPAGHLDRTFGQNGTVTPPAVTGGEFVIGGVAVDGKGRIIVAGTSTPAQPQGKELPTHIEALSQPYEAAHSDARVLRYRPDGKLDPSFGQGGILETDLGLPTPEFENVKLASAPAIEVTGVAVDSSERIVITGGAASSVASDCFHDDYFGSISYASYVARVTEAGSLDPSFATGGVFGGRLKSENPLGFEDAAYPAITPNGGVIIQRDGWGHCARGTGALGYVRLSPAGKVADVGSPPALGGRVFDATAAPDGSTVILLAPPKGKEYEPEVIEKIGPSGSLDPSFGKGGKFTLRLPGESGADLVRVAPDGEVLVQGTVVPKYRQGEREEKWWGRFSPMLIGITSKGTRDTRFGHRGYVVKHVARWNEHGGLWLDAEGRPTITFGYRPKGGPLGLAAIRFDLGS